MSCRRMNRLKRFGSEEESGKEAEEEKSVRRMEEDCRRRSALQASNGRGRMVFQEECEGEKELKMMVVPRQIGWMLRGTRRLL